MQRTTTKWAVHKAGTNSFGYMCSFKEEAEQILADLHHNILHMSEDELKKYHVVEVKMTWNE